MGAGLAFVNPPIRPAPDMIVLPLLVGDGVTSSFRLPEGVNINRDFIFKGGILQKHGIGDDYITSGKNVVFAAPPTEGLVLYVLRFLSIAGLGMIRQSFVGNGTATLFQLASVPAVNGEFVFKGGFFQRRGTGGDDYILADKDIIFETAPKNGINIEVFYFQAAANLALLRDTFEGDGAKTNFNMTGSPLFGGLFVFRGGLYQRGDGYDFTLINQSIISFPAAPANGINIEARYFG